MKTIQMSWFRLAVLVAAVACSIDSARAQGLTANPPQLIFNGATAPTQALQITSSTGQANVTISAFSNNNWLVVSPASGVTPLTVAVSIGPNAPTATDVGFINISTTGSFLSVPVQFNPNSAGGISPIITNPNSLSFNFAANSTVPATQTVMLSAANSGVTSFTASPVASNGGNWLTVSPSTGGFPSTLQVTVNPATLQGGGTFNAAIAISAPGTNGVSLPILVTIAGVPAITVSSSKLFFGYQTGTNQPLAQNLLVTSSTGANVAFTASSKTSSCGSNWLVVSPQAAATPGSLSVQVNTSGLNAGSCSGEIDISAPSASNPSVVVPVSLLVSNNPLLQVPSTGPTFTYLLGSGTVPAAQNVQITSSTPGLNFNVTAAAASGSPNFLLLSSATGTTPAAIGLSVNPQTLNNLGPGTYTETVTVSASGIDNSPQSFPVTLVVNSNPVLTTTVPSLNFNYEIGQTPPPQQVVTINTTGAPLNYQVAVNVSSCPGFLSATPSSGSTFSPPPQNVNMVAVAVKVNGLATPQVCSGNITVTSPGSTSPALVIPITLNVSSTPLLNVGQPAINVTALVGAGVTAQTISVSSTDPNTALPFTAVANTNPVGLTWLGVTPNSGNTPNNLQVTINPANLQPGTYTGSITVSSTAANVPAQTIPVTLIVASATVTATPTSLAFAQVVNGAQPAAQTVQISGVPAGVTIGAVPTTLNGTGWLTTSVSGNSVTVNANGAQLPIGTYQGVATVIVPGTGNSPLYIPVTLTVSSAPTLSVSPSSVGFTYTSGSTIPASQTVAVSSTASIPFTATFTPGAGISNPGNFITVTPSSGNAPATLTLAVNPTIVAGLSPGVYTGTVTVSSSGVPNQTVGVTLTVGAAPPPAVLAITNAASLQSGPVSPGEIITIFGTNVGPALPPGGTSFSFTASGMVPTSLAGVTVTFNGVFAPLLFVNSTQINAIVPYEVAGHTTANVVVMFGGSTSATVQLNVVDTRPAIFSLTESGSGQGAILNQDNTVNGSNSPATQGSVIQIYATGEGQLVPGVQTGSVTPGVPPFPKPSATPINVTIGGQPAQITYAGEAPTLVSGVIQVNAVVPTGIASGNQAVVLTIGTSSNNTQSITVAVK